MTFEEIQRRAIAEWESLQRTHRPRILVGAATCGQAAGANAVLAAISVELAERNIDAILTQVGCIGLCYLEPLVDIIKPGRPRICYARVTPELARQLIRDYVQNDNPRPDLALGTIGEVDIAGIPRLFDHPMLKPQVRIALRNCGHIDPERIEHYIANDGYSGFVKALQMTPAEVIEEVKRSGLRGRGGAGFLTGLKWEFCHKSPGGEKYIICNADEGDPGAFMDRSVLEGDPHSVLEGMLIGAYAMGASEAYIYCRAEYPLAIQRLNIALHQMEDFGLLGDRILGYPFSFHIKIKEGAGAFVCGEETALMASIEGRRGMPRPRPPFPAQAGLWGKPTNINNVETWANIPPILTKGGQWFASYGTEKSKGTKNFSLVGKVNNTGLIEVPMGIPLRDIIFEIGGGIPEGKRFKAAQTGGPSGGCLSTQHLDLPVDYERLAEVGSIMGSGGLVVMDEDTCMVDVAKFFLTFTQSESCGKCVPCRVGTRQMLEVLERITRGKGEMEDIDRLLELGETVRAGSLCGLGQTAPNPVISTLRYFRDEYEAHIKKKRCPAVVCKALVIAPCRHTCPAGINVPRYVRAIGEGRFTEALAVIREKIPFPSICGHVCFHPCETKCRRGQVDDPIAIRMLKRVAAEHDDGAWKSYSKVAPPTGTRVAVVGSGPAGLTAAFYLAKLGHAVTVFEALPKAGGMMRYGIPDYRLPQAELDKEIEIIQSIGVDIKTNSRVTSVEELWKQGYHAIFVGVGAHRGMKLGVPGEDSPGVMDCVTFLREVKLGKEIKLGNRVVVIGGGNAAIDAARTALRLGARDVTIVYRRSREEMPASPEEIEEALHEGVKIEYLAAPTKIETAGSVLRLECLRMKLGAVDASGRRRPEPLAGSEFTMEVDSIIAAIGQMPDLSAGFGLPLGRGDTAQVDAETLMTDKAGIFAGGDAVSGPASVIEAIAAGREAASSIDRYLGGTGFIDEALAPPEAKAELGKIEEEEKRRPAMPMLPADQRLSGFTEVELGYSEEMAIEEAGRCLKCDLEEQEEMEEEPSAERVGAPR